MKMMGLSDMFLMEINADGFPSYMSMLKRMPLIGSTVTNFFQLVGFDC